MQKNIEEKSITEKPIKQRFKSKSAKHKVLSNGDVVVSGSVANGKPLLGLKITKVKFQNKEYYLKANRYLLLIILKYLIENNKINLEKDLPIKNKISEKRCLLNSKAIHNDGQKMRDKLVLRLGDWKLFIESKFDTNTIHNACFRLLRRYKIPIDSLEVQYSKNRLNMDSKYEVKLKRLGYCET